MKNSEKSLNTVSWVAGITAIAAAMLLVVLLLLSLAGRIHPRKQALHLYTPDIAQVYDETALTVSMPELRGWRLREGHTLSVTARPEYSRVGEYPNAPEYVILDETGADVTDRYAIIEEFGTVRIIVDVCFAAVGFVLGGTLGLGTIVCACLVGPTAQIFMPFSEKLCNRFLHKTTVS